MSSFPLTLQHSIRALALRVLREILRNQPARFKNYAELTIMKTLEAHKDSHKEVSQASGLGILSRWVWGCSEDVGREECGSLCSLRQGVAPFELGPDHATGQRAHC